MAKICLYFELHQPYRLVDTSVFDIGFTKDYFLDQEKKNQNIFQKVARKSYIPMLTLLLKLARENREFSFSFSATGVFLEQALEYAPVVVTLLQKLVATGQVEVLAETYHHSLASLYSEKEFKDQVKAHEQVIQRLFATTPKVFRNTELIYSNQIGEMVADMGYKGCLTEAVERYLYGEKRTQLFVGKTKKKIALLLKHAQLSDDIAFRFSEQSWVSYPLTADTYLSWMTAYAHDEIINLFMDFETFGEHQWENTGIFDFFQVFVEKALQEEKVVFVTPSELIGLDMISEEIIKYAERPHHSKAVLLETRSSAVIPTEDKVPTYDVPEPISWADVDRDLTAWLANDLQKDTIQKLYALEEKIVSQKDKKVIADWRKLQTSDHFYYMCTKWAADGDVHAYFSPYQSPYEAYRRYAIVLADLQERML